MSVYPVFHFFFFRVLRCPSGQVSLACIGKRFGPCAKSKDNEDDKRANLAEYARSSETVKAFCGRVGMHAWQFYYFINRRGDKIKLLMWDSTGFAMYYKQLEKVIFEV